MGRANWKNKQKSKFSISKLVRLGKCYSPLNRQLDYIAVREKSMQEGVYLVQSARSTHVQHEDRRGLGSMSLGG